MKKLTDFTPSSLLFFFLSLFFIYKTNPPSHVLSSSDTTHSHRHKIKNQLQKSKINHWNKIVGSVLMEIGEGVDVDWF